LKKINLYICVLLVYALFITSCSSGNGGSSQSSDTYQSFYSGEDQTQYFIKPLIFESDGGEEFIIDFTFRQTGKIADSTTANYTIESDYKIAEIDSVRFISDNTSYSFPSDERFFLERDGDTYRVRFSSKIYTDRFFDMFGSDEWSVELLINDKSVFFESTSSTEDDIDELNDYLIELIDYR
jgi:hypothetical protein